MESKILGLTTPAEKGSSKLTHQKELLILQTYPTKKACQRLKMETSKDTGEKAQPMSKLQKVTIKCNPQCPCKIQETQ